MPDAVRDAVERTVQATIGTRERAQEAVDEIVRSADTSRRAVTTRVREALEDARPATAEDIKDLRKELRAIGRRLDAIEERLPAKRAPAKKKKTK